MNNQQAVKCDILTTSRNKSQYLSGASSGDKGYIVLKRKERLIGLEEAFSLERPQRRLTYRIGDHEVGTNHLKDVVVDGRDEPRCNLRISHGRHSHGYQ